MRGYQHAPTVDERKDMRMREYQKALGVHEPKDMKMRGCKGTSKCTET